MADLYCVYCRAKTIVRNGFRRTILRGKIQIYKCKKCGRFFCADQGFRWKHKSKDTIIDALELYVGGGVSLRFLAAYLNLSKNSITNWIYEYAEMICRFVERLKPPISTKLHLDELFLKMLGQFFYLWSSISAENRFATFVFSPNRRNIEAEKLIRKSPKALSMIFDGAFQYPSVIKKLFGVWWYYHHCHRCKDFEDKKNNNMIERHNNFVRSKIHQRRGFRSLKTGELQIGLLFAYYNFIREHSAIKTTPGEKAGIIDYGGKTSEKEMVAYNKKGCPERQFYLVSHIKRFLGQSRTLRAAPAGTTKALLC